MVELRMLECLCFERTLVPILPTRKQLSIHVMILASCSLMVKVTMPPVGPLLVGVSGGSSSDRPTTSFAAGRNMQKRGTGRLSSNTCSCRWAPDARARPPTCTCVVQGHRGASVLTE